MRDGNNEGNNILLIKHSRTNYINTGIDVLYLTCLEEKVINIKSIIESYEFLVIDEDLPIIILVLAYSRNLFIYSNYTFFTCSEYIKHKILNSKQPLNNYQARIFLIIYLFVYKLVNSSNQIFVNNIYQLAINVEISHIKDTINKGGYWIPIKEILQYYKDQNIGIEKKKTTIIASSDENVNNFSIEYQHIILNKLLNLENFDVSEEIYFSDVEIFIKALKEIDKKEV